MINKDTLVGFHQFLCPIPQKLQTFNKGTLSVPTHITSVLTFSPYICAIVAANFLSFK